MRVSRYAALFERLEINHQKAFIPFTVLGYPDRETSLAVLKTLVDSGVSALELGFAFSDPMADGPIIQHAAKQTLETGFNVNQALELIQEIRDYAPELPIGLLVYYNMVLARGIEKFFADVANAGVDGVLIADLPPESMDEVAPAAKENAVDLIHIVSPLTTDVRLKTIAKHASGFLYVVSRVGITGVEERFDVQLSSMMQRIQSQVNLPLCVGFGISKPEHAQQMIEAGADGVITGSRVIQLIQDTSDSQARLDAIQAFATSMVKVCQSSAATV